MAEVNINARSNHLIYSCFDTVYVLRALYLKNCPSGHANCQLEDIDYLHTSQSTQQDAGHVSFGQINVRGPHTHQYNKATGSVYTTAHITGSHTCPSGHANCQIDTETKTFAGDSYSLTNTDSSPDPGEINVNKLHSHNYVGNPSTTGTINCWASECAYGHSKCVLTNFQTLYDVAAPAQSLTTTNART